MTNGMMLPFSKLTYNAPYKEGQFFWHGLEESFLHIPDKTLALLNFNCSALASLWYILIILSNLVVFSTIL